MKQSRKFTSAHCTLCVILLVAAAAWSVGWGNEIHASPMATFAGNWMLPSMYFFSFWGLFQLALGVWVGIDARRRGMNGFLWGILVFFTCIVGLVVYLLVVQSAGAPMSGIAGTESACAGCGARIRQDFRVCPHCGYSSRSRCPECARPVEEGWKYCSYCKAGLSSPSSP